MRWLKEWQEGSMVKVEGEGKNARDINSKRNKSKMSGDIDGNVKSRNGNGHNFSGQSRER